jgi:hypothetical protein
MNELTLEDLVSETDDFEPEAIELVLNRVNEFDALGFGIDVVDWEVIGAGSSKQVGVLFDMKNDRYGYYTDNGQTVLVKLDKTYTELSDWGNCWDDCPEVLQSTDE